MTRRQKKSDEQQAVTSSEMNGNPSEDTLGSPSATPDLDGVANTEVAMGLQSDPEGDLTNGSDSAAGSGGLSGAARLGVYVIGFALLGIGVGMGYSLLSSSQPAPDKPAVAVADPVPVDSKVGDNKPITSEDPLREWNIRSAAYISPLISQLARQPRETLGGQILLCREQRSTLEQVLELEAPPTEEVAVAFDRWRDSLKKSLDNCVNSEPSGSDQADIKRIVADVQKTEPLFADFLRLQRPVVDVTYDANPDMFE